MKVLTIGYLDYCGKEEKNYCLIEEFNLSECSVGKKIVVEQDQTRHIGKVLCYQEYIPDNFPTNMAAFVRVATKKDLLREEQNQKESAKAISFASSQAKKLNLNMHFIDSYYTFDRKQLFFSYVADGRVDFRELAKILAQKYKTRIELRQVGVRDKAKKVGGLGPCGLFLCCNTFLTDFASVSINMAKNQFLALNPNKINGLCGRLLCCLNYEDEVYTDLKKDLPNLGSLVETKEGLGKVVAIDIFKKSYQVEIKDKGLFDFEL